MGFRLWAVTLVSVAIVLGVSSVSIERTGVRTSTEAIAKPKAKKRVARCVRYNQVLGGDKQSVDISLRNRCRVPMTCSVEWKITCDADEADAEPRDFAKVVELGKGMRESVNASAAACGDDGWAVDDIKWDCEPL